jgi:hypothetical protein
MAMRHGPAESRSGWQLKHAAIAAAALVLFARDGYERTHPRDRADDHPRLRNAPPCSAC